MLAAPCCFVAADLGACYQESCFMLALTIPHCFLCLCVKRLARKVRRRLPCCDRLCALQGKGAYWWRCTAQGQEAAWVPGWEDPHQQPWPAQVAAERVQAARLWHHGDQRQGAEPGQHQGAPAESRVHHAQQDMRQGQLCSTCGAVMPRSSFQRHHV